MFSILQLLPFLNTGMIPTILNILIYIGLSWGLFILAKKCELEHPVYAWIPFARLFVLGQLADRFCAEEGKVTRYRRIFPILSIIGEAILVLISLSITAVSAAYIAAMIVSYCLILVGAATGILAVLAALGYLLFLASLLLFAWLTSILSALSSLVALATYGLRIWALYPVYKRCNENNVVLFTILSAVFNFAPSIILPCLAQKYEPETADGFDAYLS